MKKIPPHAGVTVKEEVLDRAGGYRPAARQLHVPYAHLHRILNGVDPLSEEMAIRLQRHFEIPAWPLMLRQLQRNMALAQNKIETQESTAQPTAKKNQDKVSIIKREDSAPPAKSNKDYLHKVSSYRKRLARNKARSSANKKGGPSTHVIHKLKKRSTKRGSE